MTKRISVIGVEGSGKTYFINNIFNIPHYNKIYEPIFEINKILKTTTLDSKEKQKIIHDLILHRDINLETNKNYIIERDYIGAVYIFKLDNSKFYDIIINNFIKNYNQYLPNIVIFYNTPAEVCYERIKLRNRSYENSLTITDINNKIDKHYKLLELYKSLNINIYNYVEGKDSYSKLIKYINSNNYNLFEYFRFKLLNPKIIVIEGNICSGKTSILNYYKDNGYTVIFEPFDKMNSDYNKDFITDFYKDQINRYNNIDSKSSISLNIQIMTYLYKKNMYNNINKNINKQHKNNIIFIERTILSGYDIFVKSNIFTNNEINILHSLYYNKSTINTNELINELCYNANKILYIDVKPDICIQRYYTRTKDHTYFDISEDIINLDFLRLIDYNYYMMNKKLKSNNINVKYFSNEISLEDIILKINKYLKINK